jgi:hypothetical protein
MNNTPVKLQRSAPKVPDPEAGLGLIWLVENPDPLTAPLSTWGSSSSSQPASRTGPKVPDPNAGLGFDNTFVFGHRSLTIPTITNNAASNQSPASGASPNAPLASADPIGYTNMLASRLPPSLFESPTATRSAAPPFPESPIDKVEPVQPSAPQDSGWDKYRLESLESSEEKALIKAVREAETSHPQMEKVTKTDSADEIEMIKVILRKQTDILVDYKRQQAKLQKQVQRLTDRVLELENRLDEESSSSADDEDDDDDDEDGDEGEEERNVVPKKRSAPRRAGRSALVSKKAKTNDAGREEKRRQPMRKGKDGLKGAFRLLQEGRLDDFLEESATNPAYRLLEPAFALLGNFGQGHSRETLTDLWWLCWDDKLKVVMLESHGQKGKCCACNCRRTLRYRFLEETERGPVSRGRIGPCCYEVKFSPLMDVVTTCKELLNVLDDEKLGRFTLATGETVVGFDGYARVCLEPILDKIRQAPANMHVRVLNDRRPGSAYNPLILDEDDDVEHDEDDPEEEGDEDDDVYAEDEDD